MATYNSWNGVPLFLQPGAAYGCSERGMEVPRFVVSDYKGVEGVCGSHHLTEEEYQAAALCVKAGLM